MKLVRTEFDAPFLPESMRILLEGARIYDSSCSRQTRTLLIEGAQRCFLKLDEQGKLAREAAMLRWLGGFAPVPQLLDYVSGPEGDFLLTIALEGEDGIAEAHLADPQRLARILGESLRRFHALPAKGCPFPHRNEELIKEAEANIAIGRFDPNVFTFDPARAAQRFVELKTIALEDVLMHGDYCLPNLILKDWSLAGFVDLGNSGIGDRHNDLWWGIWTLEYNLGTPIYRDAFLDAYGRECYDPKRLELCGLLVAFTF